jgi:hypothetical protein
MLRSGIFRLLPYAYAGIAVQRCSTARTTTIVPAQVSLRRYCARHHEGLARIEFSALIPDT